MANLRINLKKIIKAANEALKSEGYRLTLCRAPTCNNYYVILEGNRVVSHAHKYAKPISALYATTVAVINTVKYGCVSFSAATWESIDGEEVIISLSVWTDQQNIDLAWTVSLEGETVKVKEMKMLKQKRGRNFTITNGEEIINEWKAGLTEYFSNLVGMLLLIKQLSKEGI
jgi:hypothetical protein